MFCVYYNCLFIYLFLPLYCEVLEDNNFLYHQITVNLLCLVQVLMHHWYSISVCWLNEWVSEWVKYKLISFSSLSFMICPGPHNYFIPHFLLGPTKRTASNFLTSVLLLKSLQCHLLPCISAETWPLLMDLFQKNCLLLKAFPDLLKTYVITYSFFSISKALDFYFSYGIDLNAI